MPVLQRPRTSSLVLTSIAVQVLDIQRAEEARREAQVEKDRQVRYNLRYGI